MPYWIEAAEQYGLRDLTDQVSENPNVHGVLIDLHPLWLYYWKLYLERGYDDNSILDEELYFLRGPRIGIDFWSLSRQITYFNTTVPINLSWRPKRWDSMIQKSNFVVKILLKPGTERIDIKYEGQLTIWQEHRPVPHLATIEGGISLGNAANPPGTLGGILVDHSAKKHYGLSCGHVISKGNTADHPSQKDSSTIISIGTCVLSHIPSPNNGILCNSHNPAVLNEIDIGLIEIDSKLTSSCSIQKIGNLSGITPGRLVAGNLKVEFTGRSSGHKSLVTGGVGVIQQISFGNGTTCCFKELVELKEPSMNGLYLSRPVHGGDSGAWVTTQGTTGTEWCAMIVAEDRQTGYAIVAESLMDFLASNGYPNLSCC